MLFTDSTIKPPAPPPPPVPDHPTPPFRVEWKSYDPGRGLAPSPPRPVKIYPPGQWGTELAEGEEIPMWAYVEWLESENKRLTALAETAPLAASGPPAAPIAPEVASTTSAGFVAMASSSIETDQPTNANADETLEDTAVAKRARATSELLADPSASNPTLALRANCSDELIRKIRHQLIGDGKLPPLAVKKDGPPATANATDSQAEQAVGVTAVN